LKNIIFESYRIAVRSKSLFRNIDINYLMNKFKTNGYAFRIPPPVINPVADETSVGFKGPLLQKGEIIIDVNSDINSIGIQCNSMDSLIKELETVFLPNIKAMNLFYKNIWFYELQLKIKKQNNEQSLFKTFYSSDENKEFEIIKNIDTNMTMSGLTLWDSGNPNMEDFTEMRLFIDPLDTELLVYKIILRNKEELTFMKKIKSINQNIKFENTT
jgi:hypothetical protein